MAVPFEGGSNYRNKLAQRQAAKKLREQADMPNTDANAGPPSASRFFTKSMGTRPSTNRFGYKGVTGRDSIPDKAFEMGVRLGVSSAKDIGVSGSQILNEAANVGVLPTIFGKDYLARGAGSLIGMADKRAGEQFEDTATGEVTAMDIVNVSDIFSPGAGRAVKAGIKGLRSAPSVYRGMVAQSQKMGIIPQEFNNIEDTLNRLSREARQAGKGPAPKIEEVPRNITAFTPSKKDIEGFWETVEKPAIDDISGLPSFDPSEIRSAAFGGVGALVKGTPLENLSDLAVPNKATTIRAIYKPPSAKEILSMMKRTDSAVPSRLKAKKDRLQIQIDRAQEEGDMDTAIRLAAEMDTTMDPKKWKKNKYTIKDAEMLRDRWIEASKHFEEKYGTPLPWRLEADYLDEAGEIKTARIFGQDVEHKIPVNRGGKGAVDELTLLPTIPNTGKRDYSWDDYASKNPDEWNSLIDVLYGSGKRY